MVSVLERLKALDEQRAKLLDDAKQEALGNAQKAVDELNQLGFAYSLSEGSSASRGPRKASSKAEGVKRQPRDLPCPICNFKLPLTMTDGCIGIRGPKSHSPLKSLWKNI
jgi:hypothetical protein